MPENLENAVQTETAEKAETEYLEVQVTKASPLMEAALKFYALRMGMTVTEYCTHAILYSLQGDEDQGDGTFSPIADTMRR
jgi:hypothetical protein